MHLLALELRKISSCEAFLDVEVQTKTFYCPRNGPCVSPALYIVGSVVFQALSELFMFIKSHKVITVMNKLSHRTVMPLCASGTRRWFWKMWNYFWFSCAAFSKADFDVNELWVTEVTSESDRESPHWLLLNRLHTLLWGVLPVFSSLVRGAICKKSWVLQPVKYWSFDLPSQSISILRDRTSHSIFMHLHWCLSKKPLSVRVNHIFSEFIPDTL